MTLTKTQREQAQVIYEDAEITVEKTVSGDRTTYSVQYKNDYLRYTFTPPTGDIPEKWENVVWKVNFQSDADIYTRYKTFSRGLTECV